MTAQQGAAAPTQVADPRRWKALAVVLIATFMILLDISIVNVAIPSIQRDLGATYAEIQWVLAGYQLAYAVVLITGGRLGDIFGRKRLFIIGVSGFTLASALCGLAQNPVMLVASRIVQGLMAALMYPQVLSVIQVGFPPRERGTAFGIFGGIIGIAAISGPLLGGLLISADVHIANIALLWRPIFLVNLPIGIGAVIAASVYLRESRAPDAPRLDIPGTVLATAGLFLIAFPLVEGRDAGWAPWTYLMIVGGVAVMAIFGRYIRSCARRGGHPLVEPRLFGDRAFVVGSAIAMVFFAGIPAFFLTFSLYIQIGLGFSALHAGLTTLPWALAAAIASGISIRLAPRLGKRILSLGCIALVIGIAALWLTVKTAGTAVNSYEMIPALALGGVGLGLVVAPLINIILAGIQSGFAGSASGVLTTVQQIGGALGVAVIGIIFFGQVSSYAPVVAQSSAQQLSAQLTAAGLPPSLVTSTTRVFSRCFIERSTSNDPTATLPGCPSLSDSSAATPCLGPPQGCAVARILPAVAQEAVAANFDNAFRDALYFELTVFALVFLMVFVLPSPTGLYGAVPRPAAAAAASTAPVATGPA
ncbi:MAG TPA: MFS transporter [Candidatus Dormibacteraeota bacterium]|nr:MFS transporter [Candidatus Dormibacteraeota bacterium]